MVLPRGCVYQPLYTIILFDVSQVAENLGLGPLNWLFSGS